MACGSLDTCLICLAVDLEDSSFLASCLTLLAGSFCRSILESSIVLETNSLSLRKTKICLYVGSAFSGGYFAILI